jgi:hypothetical protein
VIDFFDLRSKGTHAIYLHDGSMRFTTVADARGERPWTQPVRRSPRQSQQRAAQASDAGSQSEPDEREDEDQEHQ